MPSDDGIETRHLTIERRIRYATLGPAAEAAAEVWFALHGYGQLAPRFARYLSVLDDGARLIVAPEGLHRYYVDHAARKVGASWMTSEDRLTDIDDYVRYLDRLHRVTLGDGDGARVVALGFSQGVHTLCRWLAFGKAEVDLAVVWGAPPPPDLDMEARAGSMGRSRWLVVAGEEDEHFGEDAVRAAIGRFRAAGLAHDTIRFAGGHRLDAEVLRRIAEGA